MSDTFSVQTISALCGPAAQQISIEMVAETGSTNVDLLARLDHLNLPTLLVAETQTAGRGRAGRAWYSAPGVTLTFSLAWKFQRPVQALVGLPLAVGVAIAEALAQFGVEAQLKWPNDVLRHGSKMGGVLIETASAKNTDDNAIWAVIGIGVNLAMPESLIAKIGRTTVAAAAASPLQLDRNQLLAALMNRLADALHAFEEYGFEVFVDRWNRLHAYAGRQVVILDRDHVVQQGRAVGVDTIGRLLLETAAGEVAVMAGDVSLRIQEG